MNEKIKKLVIFTVHCYEENSLTNFPAVFFLAVTATQTSYAKVTISRAYGYPEFRRFGRDTKNLISIINTVIDASGNFDINPVADFYTPNALVADEEPPFSWNGPTAGAQWINAVEKTCQDLKIKRLKGKIGHINVTCRTTKAFM